MAAVLSAGPGAVLSHRSAGSLWGILPQMSILPEVTRVTRCQARSGLKSHCGVLRADEVTRVNGIPVTSPPRTVFDIAATLTMVELEGALNEMEVRGITDELSIPDLLERFAAMLEGGDLPRPRRNADLVVRGRIFEADCLWARQRVIVELDGRAAHGTRRAFEKDRERDRLLQVDGWRVVRITWRQLRDDAPVVLADLSTLLRTLPPRPTL